MRYRTNRITVDFCCDGTLQQTDLDNQAALSFDIQHCPVNSGQRTMLDRDRLSDFKKGPWFARQARFEHRSQRVNLVLMNWGRSLAEAHNPDYTWRREYRQPPGRVELAEHIARKHWRLDDLSPIRPDASACAER
jgi:hypothetical protein